MSDQKRRRPKAVPATTWKMHTIYISSKDMARADELEHQAKALGSIKGRIGLSLVLRTALRLLAGNPNAIELIEAEAEREE